MTRTNKMKLSRPSAALVGLLLLAGLFPASVQAAPCGDVTITPAAQSNAATCEDGTTVRTVTTTLGNLNRSTNTAAQITASGTGALTINIARATTLGGAYGSVVGGLNLSSLTGGATVNVEERSGAWSFSGTATSFGSGNDTINNAGLVMVAAGIRQARAAGLPASTFQRLIQTTVDFGAGQDSFNNTGTMLVGDAEMTVTSATTGTILDKFMGNPRPVLNSYVVASEVTFQGLESFNNSGLIVMGGYAYTGGNGGAGNLPASSGFGPRFYTSDAVGEAYCRQVFRGVGLANLPPEGGFLCTDSPVLAGDTDRRINGVLSMPGTLFTGVGASAIKLDVEFGNGLAQRNCQERTGGFEVFFELPGADCVDIRNGETAGSTQIIVRDAAPLDQGAHNLEGIVIIDVSGGTSAPEHFTLSPESDSYRETVGGRGVIDKGLFVFPLIYDAETQQHKLIGMPGASALQLPLLTHAAQSLARQVTASGLDERSQNVRAALRAGTAVAGGFWGEFSQGTIERDLIQPMTVFGEAFAFNNDYEQDNSAMVLGGDWLIATGDKSVWLLGGSIGYTRSELSFTQSGNQTDLEGVAVGVHGGYHSGHWFVNAGYSQGFLQVDDYVPTFNLSTDGSGADTNAQTQSVRVDGGRRFPLTDAFHIEPLATIAWVRADFDDLVVASPNNPLATSNTAKFGNALSLRGALGARVGFEQALSKLRIGYALTGRYWNEFEGKTSVRIQSTGPEAALSDTFDGSFLDLAGRISVSDAEGHVSGYVDATSVSGDDYSSLGFSAGFRYQW